MTHFPLPTVETNLDLSVESHKEMIHLFKESFGYGVGQETGTTNKFWRTNPFVFVDVYNHTDLSHKIVSEHGGAYDVDFSHPFKGFDIDKDITDNRDRYGMLEPCAVILPSHYSGKKPDECFDLNDETPWKRAIETKNYVALATAQKLAGGLHFNRPYVHVFARYDDLQKHLSDATMAYNSVFDKDFKRRVVDISPFRENYTAQIMRDFCNFYDMNDYDRDDVDGLSSKRKKSRKTKRIEPTFVDDLKDKGITHSEQIIQLITTQRARYFAHRKQKDKVAKPYDEQEKEAKDKAKEDILKDYREDKNLVSAEEYTQTQREKELTNLAVIHMAFR